MFESKRFYCNASKYCEHMRANMFVLLTDKYSHRNLHREVTEVRAMYCHDCSKTLVNSGHEPSFCLINSTNKIHAKHHNVTQS